SSVEFSGFDKFVVPRLPCLKFFVVSVHRFHLNNPSAGREKELPLVSPTPSPRSTRAFKALWPHPTWEGDTQREREATFHPYLLSCTKQHPVLRRERERVLLKEGESHRETHSGYSHYG
ncbi:unnamed protein product, partial [Arctogadus glacialis]